MDNLSTFEEDLRQTLVGWLGTLPEPEALNIGVKQVGLKRKLRWESMMSSRDKIVKLKGFFRNLRIKKNR